MTQKTFDELWRWINARGSVITVQEENELHHIYDLMKSCDCQSYLEIGTAEGNSLYVLGHAVDLKSRDKKISYIDFGEDHTKAAREEAINKLCSDNFGVPDIMSGVEENELLKHVEGFFGDSTRPETHPKIRKYDCVLIDGAHDYSSVLSDSIMYANLARKYVFWHDIQLPEVRAAYEWFKKRWQLGEYSEFIDSTSFGYGIFKVKK